MTEMMEKQSATYECVNMEHNKRRPRRRRRIGGGGGWEGKLFVSMFVTLLCLRVASCSPSPPSSSSSSSLEKSSSATSATGRNNKEEKDGLLFGIFYLGDQAFPLIV